MAPMESSSRRPSSSLRRRRTQKSRRAVSDVVATILLLALTVVLFSTIFAAVTSFPSPPAQNANQFQAQIIQETNTSNTNNPYMAKGLSILHLAGPEVPASALIYIKSAGYPNGPEFKSPYHLSAGGISGTTWNLGQTWYLTNFTGTCTTNPGDICNPILPDNLTVYIISGSSLLFSVVLPGTVINTPPTFVTVYTTPSVPAVGESFTVYAAILGVSSTNTVRLNLSGIPGGPTASVAMSYSGTAGLWYYRLTAGLTTTPGSYYGFLTASTTSGLTGTASVPVTITSYSTLISTAITPGTATYGTCSTSTSHSPVAACQGSSTQEYYFSVTVSASLVTLGSVWFEVYTTATGAAYATAGHAVFAIANSSAATTPMLSWAGPAKGPMLIASSNWTATYGTGFTTNTPLVTTLVISMDVGTTKPSATAGTLSFVILGVGVYAGQSTVVSLPAS